MFELLQPVWIFQFSAGSVSSCVWSIVVFHYWKPDPFWSPTPDLHIEHNHVSTIADIQKQSVYLKDNTVEPWQILRLYPLWGCAVWTWSDRRKQRKSKESFFSLSSSLPLSFSPVELEELATYCVSWLYVRRCVFWLVDHSTEVVCNPYCCWNATAVIREDLCAVPRDGVRMPACVCGCVCMPHARY